MNSITEPCRNCGRSDLVTRMLGLFRCGHCEAYWRGSEVDMPLLWEGD